MSFQLKRTPIAAQQYKQLEAKPDKAKVLKAVRKALGYLQTNPKHPGLHTHEYQSLTGANGEKVFEAYAQNKTPGAYRIFWHYGPGEKTITIIAITPHP